MNTPINFSEYGPKRCGCIRKGEAPTCPFICVIPSVTVQSTSGIKGLADCFVKVTDINAVYYIDDKSRVMEIWKGDLYIDDYDYAVNPLKLREQTVYDFKNNRAIVYNTIGQYRLTTLTEA